MNGEEVHILVWPFAHDPMDAAIKFLTRGEGTHASFYSMRRHKIVENFYPHVRERLFEPGERARVEFYRIEGASASDFDRLEKWFDLELANPPAYSIKNLFRYAVNLPPVPGLPCFCSQWVLRGLRLNLAPEKQVLKRLEYQDFASPRDIRISPRCLPDVAGEMNGAHASAWRPRRSLFRRR